MNNEAKRHLAASLTKQLLLNQITFDQLVSNYPEDTKDKEIDLLFDLIEHQPQLGGMFGVNKNEYDEYNSKILRLAEILEK